MLPKLPRRLIEVGFWILLLSASALINTTSVIMEAERRGDPLPLWEPFTWEFSSAAVLGALVPLVAWWLTRFPIHRSTWKISVPAHLLATIPFSLAHVTGMVAIRKLVYLLKGQNYDFGDIPIELLYEYRKDLWTYWVIVSVIWAYRYYRVTRARQRGGQLALDLIRAHPEASAHRYRERFIVKTKNREIIVHARDIAWIEASGNYVILHLDDDSYTVRDTMTALENTLDPGQFARVHRSRIVNLDRIKEIHPWFHGDYRIIMHDGTIVNFSRRYRSRLSSAT